MMRKLDPIDHLNQLVERLRKQFESVFNLASPDAQFTTRDKGHYAYLYGRPTRRLATALSIDREVLILFSSFEDQQQRTIKVARELIGESDGRLEGTIAIIVHKDPEGNSKLPKWGRAVGLAVLPVFAGRMPTTPEELERHLCHELFSHDPFDVTGPVSDDENFYGRRNEALDLARKLQTGQIRSCLGIRKIGKTSIMNRVVSEARTHHDCYCVVLDCSRDEIWSQSSSELLSSLGEAIRSSIRSHEKYAVVESPKNALSLSAAAAELLATVKMASKPVIIFIDEVDYITPGSPTSTQWKVEFNRFWRNFRAIYQEALRSAATISVMVSGVSAKWFAVDSIEGVENAALAFIPEEYLSPLPRGASIAMIKKISRTAGLAFSDDVAAYLSASCSDMPFWVRKACSYVHRNIDVAGRPTSVNMQDARRLTEEFIKKEGGTLAQVAVSHLFRVYPELREPSLKALGGDASSIGAHYVTILRKYGLLSLRDPVQLSGEMIREALIGFRDQQEADKLAEVKTAPPPNDLATTALAEWAEELAVINKERNSFEKRLRQLVVNFLRADSLAKRIKGGAKDRVLNAIPSDRRASLSMLSADDIMDKLYWLDLQNLILKEWPLFNNVFADKKQFEHHFFVVNDRPDTHAKDFDAADLALQRRSLKWLADRLASV